MRLVLEKKSSSLSKEPKLNRVTHVEGVYFCEGTLEGSDLGPISFQAPTQNTNLLEAKKLLAAQAKSMGANAVINFTYSQKADRGLNLFKWDSERLSLGGDLIKLDALPEIS